MSLLAFRAGWIVNISPKLAASIPKAFEAGTSLVAFAASLRSADQAAISAVKSLLQQKPKFNPVLRTGPTELLLRTTIHDYGIRDSIAAALDRKPK
ncbi:hypothetical protein F183_A36660 [Bryobacterales bacterium F-183]|nr:hypothetical protein F183_A36660 [Bryobacterales bacterium F-183]